MPSADWRAAAGAAVVRLGDAGVENAAVEVRWMVEEASGFDYLAALDEAVLERPAAVFERMVARRCAGEPLQYVLGRWAFRTLDLMVDTRVLIPRPETEVVVGEALRALDETAGRISVDLGTGSGAIALSLVAERPEVEVWATDSSSGALDVARANLAGLGRPAVRVRLCEGSWYDALPADLEGRVDLVVSNPPYVAAGELLPPSVADWEPVGALVAGPTGLEAIEVVVAGARRWLARPGALVVEIAPHQSTAAVAMAGVAFDTAEVRPDLAGRPRALVARLT